MADHARLSITQVRYALPPLTKALAYQLLYYLSDDNPDEPMMLRLQRLLAQMPLASLPMTDGIQTRTLSSIQPVANALYGKLFTNAVTAQQLMGALAIKTQLPPMQLAQLLPNVMTLALVGLAQLIETLTTRTSITLAELEEWIGQQSLSLNQPDDDIMAQIIGFQPRYNPQQRAKLAQFAAQSPTNTVIAQHMAALIKAQPFAIGGHRKPNTPAAPQTIQTSMTSAPTAIDDDIFTKVPVRQPSWLTRLQQHWIGVATLLSMVVFASLAWGLTKPDQLALFATPAQVTTLQTQPPIYQDIAIVRVASTTTPVPSKAARPTKPTRQINQTK